MKPGRGYIIGATSALLLGTVAIGGCEIVLGMDGDTDLLQQDAGADSTASEAGGSSSGGSSGADGSSGGSGTSAGASSGSSGTSASSSSGGGSGSSSGFPGASSGGPSPSSASSGGSDAGPPCVPITCPGTANTCIDTRNCGTCGHDCQGGGCADGVCQVVPIGTNTTYGCTSPSPWDVAVNGTNAYWNDFSCGEVLTAPIGGGTVLTLTSGQQMGGDVPSFMALEGSTLYWTGKGTGIYTEALSGGNVSTLVSDYALDLAVDANNVYWTADAITSTGWVKSMPRAGGTITTLASTQNGPAGIVVDSTSVYWLDRGGAGHDGGSGVGTVMKVPIGGGTAVTLVSATSARWGIAVDSTAVYWASSDSGEVLSVPLNGGSPTTIASGLAYPERVAVDANNIYWTERGGFGGFGGGNLGAVVRAPLKGGAKTTIASSQASPMGITLDASSVYWANRGVGSLGSVLKLAKPP